MSHWKVGFHVGPGGNRDGIGAHWQALSAEGVPAVLVSADDYGPCGELAALPGNHQIAFRLTTAGQNNGQQYDVPDYSLPPVTAADIHWLTILNRLPPEFNKQRVWLIVGNELDKERSAWLGVYGQRIIDLALGSGYKVVLFNFSAGEPEVFHWSLPDMLACIGKAALTPERVAIGLHEYSLSTGSLDLGYPWMVGRFGFLNDICQQNGIVPPSIFITELGWTHNSAPQPDVGLSHLTWADSIYKPAENVLGASLWYLGGGFGDIANTVQKYIVPVTAEALELGPHPPPEPEPGCDPRVPYNRVMHVVPGSATKARFLAIAEAAWDAGRETVGSSYDDAMHGPGLTSVTAKLWDIPTAERPLFTAFRDEFYPAAEIVFLGTDGSTPFKFDKWPSNYQQVTQGFGVQPEHYGRFGLPGHDGIDVVALQGTPIYAVAPGTVYNIHTDPETHNYGIHVHIEHASNFKTVYAHLSSIRPGLQVGQQVAAGYEIGKAGSTGNSSGPHLHLGLKSLVPEPGWPFDLTDPTKYLYPLMASPPTWPHDMADYFFPANGVAYGKIFEVSNNWGQGPEIVQLQRQGDLSFVVKNQNYERRRIAPGFVYLEKDTSRSDSEFYTVEGAWMARRTFPGDILERLEHVRVFRKSDCGLVHEYDHASKLVTAAFYNSWVSHAGVSVTSVLEFHWMIGNVIEERYWYGKGLGLVGFQRKNGDKSYISRFMPPGTPNPSWSPVCE